MLIGLFDADAAVAGTFGAVCSRVGLACGAVLFGSAAVADAAAMDVLAGAVGAAFGLPGVASPAEIAGVVDVRDRDEDVAGATGLDSDRDCSPAGVFARWSSWRYVVTRSGRCVGDDVTPVGRANWAGVRSGSALSAPALASFSGPATASFVEDVPAET